MQMNEAASKRAAWERKRNPPCDHPTIGKEYYLGTDTGDLVCGTCGETWWGKSAPEEIRRKAGYAK